MHLEMPRPVPEFSGRLITMRQPDPAGDARDYFEFNREPAMHTWSGKRALGSVVEAQVELERFMAMDRISTWVIVDHASGRVVGRYFLNLELRDGLRVAGEGNRIAKPYWRKGHNREARQFMFAYAFGPLRADRYETGAWAGNTNSIRSIEAHGFAFSRTERQWNEKHRRAMEMRYYAMTRERWECAVQM